MAEMLSFIELFILGISRYFKGLKIPLREFKGTGMICSGGRNVGLKFRSKEKQDL